MDCNRAMNFVTGYLLGHEVDKENLSLSYSHIAWCGVCQRELDATIGLLGGERLDLPSEVGKWQDCDLCRERLAEFAEMSEAEMQKKVTGFVAHLRACPACQRDYRFLQDLVRDERHGAFGVVPLGPTFAEVAREVQTTSSAIWEECPQGVRRLATEVKLLVQQGLTWLVDVPRWLRPWQVPAYTRTTRGQEVATALASLPVEQELTLPDENKNIKILLRIKSKIENRVDLTVTIQELFSNSSISGIEVSLCDGQKNILEHSVTLINRNNVIAFYNIEPSNYYLIVEGQQDTWEVHLILSQLA